MKIKDYTKVGGTANAREEKKFNMTSSSQEEEQENKNKSGKMQAIPVRKHYKSRFSVREKNNNARAEVELNIRYTLATGKDNNNKSQMSCYAFTDLSSQLWNQ